ncbi:MAG: hypothetical protein R2831_07770 [Chitinophagaceae bacterium]
MKRIIRFLPNFIKVFLLKRKGTVGPNCKMGFGSFVFSKKVSIGENFTLLKFSYIHSNEVVIGDDVRIAENTTILATKRVKIGDESFIGKNITVGGGQFKNSELDMGRKVHVYEYSYLNTTEKLTIEDEVGIGGGCYIFTHGSWQNAYDGFPYAYAPVTIKRNAWLPWRVFVMPGVTIGEQATIGSDAMVGRDIPDRSFAVGVPAKVLKSGSDFIKEMTAKDKFELMQTIFNGFSEHENYFLNQKTEVKIADKYSSIVYPNGYTIAYAIDQNEISNAHTILAEIDKEKSLKKGELDLKNRRCFKELTEIEKRLCSYISNYGIRFYKEK